MPRWFGLVSGVVAVQLLSCSPGTIRRTPDFLGGRLPAAIIVQQEITGRILSLPLKRPSGMTVDFDGNLYVCDQGNNRIVKFSPDLQPARETGGYGDDGGLFKQPVDVIVDSDNRVMVSDAVNRRIQQFDTTLTYRSQMRLEDPDEPLKFGSPSGIAVTHDGSLRIADHERNDLIFLNNAGVFERIVGDLGYRGGQLDDPQGVAVDKEDNVFVCDAGNGRIAVYDKYGEFQRAIIIDGLERPVSAIIDGSDRLWILDQQSSRVFLCTLTGTLTIPQPLQLLGAKTPIENPADMTFLKDGRLVISDSGNDRLLVCTVVPGAG